MTASVPVLMYHHINPNKNDMVTVTPEVFEAQMRHLKERGIKTLCLDELMDIIEGRARFNGKGVVITFDDGYLDNFVYAFPVLKSLGLKAAIFIVSEWAEGASLRKSDRDSLLAGFRKRPATHDEAKRLIEKGSYHKAVMDWAMMDEMKKTGLVEFHSHTRTHRDCDRLSKDELAAELEGSRETIEKRLGSRCRYLCWPRGRFNAAALGAAKQAGYSGVFTTARGVGKKGADAFNIKRIVVKDKAGWFRTRMRIYTSPVLSRLYLKVKR